MPFSLDFLAAADPMSHVLDDRLGAGLFDEGGWADKVSDSLWTLGITKQSVLFVVAGVLTVVFFWLYSKDAGRSRVPSRWGNFVETLLEFLRDNVTRPFMGTDGDRFLPLIATFFVYILICNLIGLIPFLDLIGHGGNTSPANYLITPALAICSFCIYHYLGIREQGGVWTYTKNLFPHVPIFILPIIVVIELVAHVIRPCALAIRLCANMTAGHIMMAVLIGFTTVFTKDFLIGGAAISLVSVIAVTLLTFLELLVAVIQAFVFTFLTTVFLSMAVHPEH